MNKKLICKLVALSLLSTSLLSIPNFSVNAYASSLNIENSIETDVDNSENQILSTLNTYLTAFKEFDTDTIVNVSSDIRTPNEDDYREELEIFESDPNAHLKSFEINDINKLNKNQYIVNTEVEMDNGYVYNQDFKIIKNNSTYKVVLGEEIDVDTFNDTVVKKGNLLQKEHSRSKRSSSLVRWDTDLGPNDDIGYTDKFKMNTDSVEINYRQYSIAGSNTVKVKYQIVSGIWNSVQASKTIRGQNKDRADQFDLNIGDGQTLSNARLRITNYSAANVRSFGEVYPN